jgi:chloramphenicol 3-O-phosphotransferase
MDKQGRIIIISGSPGTGKTSISRKLAEKSTYACSVHLHTDDFYGYIKKGYTAPWENGSGDQNEIVMEIIAESAEIFCKNGYDVYVDGVIGPWFIEPWIDISKKDIDVRYIVLLPDKQTTIERAFSRQKISFDLKKDIVENLWNTFSNINDYRNHIVDTTAQTIDESVIVIQEMLENGAFRMI